MFDFTKRKGLVSIVVAILLGIVIISNPFQIKPKCNLEYNKSYQILYIGAPTSYESATHKVVWIETGCGYNIEDMYRIEVSAATCQMVMENIDEAPFFVLYLPTDHENVCGQKPVELTLVPK